MSETADSKKRELLPDILGHQERMQKRRFLLNETITQLETEWMIDTSKEMLEPGPQPLDQPNNKRFSTVERIYRGMGELEGDFDSLAARLSLISKSYLGENKS